MSLLVWIAVGTACGYLADAAMRNYGLLEDIVVGVVGSVAAGWAYVALTGTSLTGVSLLGAISSLVGAITFIVLSRGITRGHSPI